MKTSQAPSRTSVETKVIEGIFFTVLFGFFLLFGFIGDRPSRAKGDVNEGWLATRSQWPSAAFYTVLPLFVMVTFGVWGFALLPLMVLVVARRLSARKGAPYELKKIHGDITELLAEGRVRNVVRVGTAVALALQLATMFGLPASFFAALASTVVWGTWLYLAYGASKMNAATDMRDKATKAKFTGIFAKAYSTPEGNWDESTFTDEGMTLIVAPVPVGAVLHFAQADSILAQVAPEWEMNHQESSKDVIVLNAASDETVQRRLEESRSGGLIAGKLSDAYATTATPVRAAVSITADDLY
ncbi:hypothetical protein NG697_12435 [Pseudarthrobacter sp. MDT3-26]|uniref:hypothetical protein n=1 Tax=Pseudarthrobacter raffinosi TaxID=2953651 RepID=UPI00208F9A0A|nr:hypothetical protein [Pseudarthrobacter sp. MDT3-26]MCO4263719.1 hypothetical protein [Pseudarthrobacter sp. MDT3-26]